MVCDTFANDEKVDGDGQRVVVAILSFWRFAKSSTSHGSKDHNNKKKVASRLPYRKSSAVRGKPRPSVVAVSPTCGHGYEGFIHLSSMHAGDGEGTAQHFTGQAINNACLGRPKREQLFGSCRTPHGGVHFFLWELWIL